MNYTELYEKLAGETGLIPWVDLQRHFARGAVVRVAKDLDLAGVAASMALDDRVAVERWLQSGRMARASDDDARRWSTPGTEVRAVVAAPWVLVQDTDLPG